ncbi:Glycosyltransferase [Xanthomarina gelatinilytica]|uniref:Glycosyltransferase n=1 Tax=Xanthomarina gelatinilytica TaxID=1137281 RepID=M7MKA8_9FLAO|nr:glycosyltransferase [Xanthomarina gelatinilytica]EMQ95526.1 Glycosyltransferase [Xanthomarina gelatinilytica]
MKLTIISHTEHYQLDDGSIVGLGSTVTEINQLLGIFDTITHVAMLHDTPAPPSALPYSSNSITFVGLPAVGGTTWAAKLQLLLQAPNILVQIHRALKQADYFQFRAPTGMGVFVIPYLMVFTSKRGWFKYAGNWKQEQAPLAYRFQKWLLESQSRPVTINGSWPNQPKHCLSFENPCLTKQELDEGQKVVANKTFSKPIELCFVGRLEAAKGVDLILEALASLDDHQSSKIATLHLVGAGNRSTAYQQHVDTLGLTVTFHGYLSRSEVHDIYKRSHAILLPSASEGFPKVIAEAMNYGCVPIVSQVSAIGQYIAHGENGLLMETVSVQALNTCLNRFLDLEEAAFKTMTQPSISFMQRFSYPYYNQRIEQDVL